MQLPSLCKFFVHIPETGILCSYTDYQNQVNSYMQKKFFLIFFHLSSGTTCNLPVFYCVFLLPQFQKIK